MAKFVRYAERMYTPVMPKFSFAPDEFKFIVHTKQHL